LSWPTLAETKIWKLRKLLSKNGRKHGYEGPGRKAASESEPEVDDGEEGKDGKGKGGEDEEDDDDYDDDGDGGGDDDDDYDDDSDEGGSIRSDAASEPTNGDPDGSVLESPLKSGAGWVLAGGLEYESGYESNEDWTMPKREVEPEGK